MESVKEEDFGTFLAERKYIVQESQIPSLLVRSFDFITSLEFCKEDPGGVIHKAQCHIAYAMSAEGGAFNPEAVGDPRILTKEGLGRNALVDEYKINESLSGSDPVSLLKRVAVAYGLLKPLLCDGGNAGGGSTIYNFDLVR